MNSKFTADFSKPTILTAQNYGRKITVEIDHSDTDLDEIMDAVETLVMGMGYHQFSWKQWILDRADEFREEDIEDLNEWKTFDEDELRHSTDDKPHWDWDEESASKRMDVIGQNGNEGLHYDSDGFEDYQNDDEDIEWPKPNDVLIDAKKQYEEQLKKESKLLNKKTSVKKTGKKKTKK